MNCITDTNEDPNIRLAAIKSLRDTNAQESIILAIINALDDDNSEVRCEAVKYLSKVGSRSVEPNVIQMIHDKNCRVRETAVKSITLSLFFMTSI